MSTLTMYKGFNPDRLYGGWFWSLKHVGGWNGTWSEPYEVELPKGFALGETVAGIEAIFAENDTQAYEVFASSNHENSVPVLIGGTHPERIRLKVLRKIEDDFDVPVNTSEKSEKDAKTQNAEKDASPKRHLAR